MSKISLRYARALADSLSEDGLVEAITDLTTVAETLSTKEVQAFFKNPQVTIENKVDLIKKVFTNKTSKEIVNLLQLVVENGKYSEIQAIADNFRQIVNEYSGSVTAEIETAEKLSEEQIIGLTASLKKLTGKNVRPEVIENKSLLAGIKVTISGDIIDLSLRNKFQRLTQALS